MNLLVVTNNPARASFRQRIGVYLDILRTKGIDCEVAKLPPSSLARRKLFKQTAEFDGVFLHKKGLNFRDAIWLRRNGKKIIYDFDDAIMYNPKTPNHNSQSHFRPFRRTVKLANMVIAGNSYLAKRAQRFNPSVRILPTGLDTKAYRVETKLKDDGKIRLVWIGSKSTLRYLVEIRPALEEIGSRFDNVVLRIICDDFFGLQNIPVEKRQWSKESEAIDLATSDIGLAPLPDNRFTRGKCGFKILQYSSAGLPVVASPVGVNSEYVLNNVTGFFATNIQEWIERITRLIEDPQLREKMGQKGQVHTEKFDVSLTGRQLAELIINCLKNVSH